MENGQKTIVFRPLRLVKKTGKITIASYMQWRSVKTADYSQFKLIVDNEYSILPPDAFVYDYAGKQLFWPDFDPDAVPVYHSAVTALLEDVRPDFSNAKFLYRGDGRPHYCVSHLDCDGVPTFSHYTADYTATHHFSSIEKFEPLTVGVVRKWFGWFLYQLDNSDLQIGR